MAPTHFLDIEGMPAEHFRALLDSATRVKDDPAIASRLLEGKHVALIFEKPSTRTRVSFEVGVTSMGGYPIALQGANMQLGRGETVEDTARALSLYVDAIVIRTHSHKRLEQLAISASVPVVNALTDSAHPCQALADLQTINEHFGTTERVRVTYLGDGNNVARSLMFACAHAGADFTMASPPGFQPPPESMARAAKVAESAGGRVVLEDDPKIACHEAQVLYTDTWTSMGQEAQRETRLEALAPYRIDEGAVSLADTDAVVMHCLPAHRGEEITDPVLDGPRSVVWQQAENRLHSQKAVLGWLLSN